MRRRRGDPARQADPRLAEHAFLIKSAEGAEEGTEEHEGILNVGHAHLMSEAIGETHSAPSSWGLRPCNLRNLGDAISGTLSRGCNLGDAISGMQSRGCNLGDAISRSHPAPYRLPDRMHRPARGAEVDSSNARAARDDRTNRRSAWAVVLHHELLRVLVGHQWSSECINGHQSSSSGTSSTSSTSSGSSSSVTCTLIPARRASSRMTKPLSPLVA
jgi:hypothetical protein